MSHATELSDTVFTEMFSDTGKKMLFTKAKPADGYCAIAIPIFNPRRYK